MQKLLLSAAVLSLVAGAALAKPEATQKHQKNERGIFRALDLSAEQRTAIKDIKTLDKQTEQQDVALREALRTQMQDNLSLGQWNEDETRRLITENVESSAPERLTRALNRHKIFNVLNAEQQNILLERQSERQTKRQSKDISKRQDKMFKRLALSEQQQAEMIATRAINEENLASAKSEFSAYKEAEKTLIQQAQFDQAAWSALNTQYKNAQVNMAMARSKARFDSLSILTAEQRAKVQSMQQKRKRKAKRAE